MPSWAVAFAPGRVNLIGEHTDYNHGLSLPFAISEGITVRARVREDEHTTVYSRELGHRDRFRTDDPERCGDWRAFARGIVSMLQQIGQPVPSTDIEITSELPPGSGLSSSAALEVALALALTALAGAEAPAPVQLAGLCSRVEREWLGAHTGLLDQLASLLGQEDAAVLIDFRALRAESIPLALHDWTLVTAQTPADRALASTAYNERRAQCAQAADLLGLGSLREATIEQLDELPETLRRRARHVISENERVKAAVIALRSGDLSALGDLLNSSHASLRDDYEVSTPAVEDSVSKLLAAGARGTRLIGGGFGGAVLALFEPDVALPPGATPRHAGDGARLMSTG